MAELLTRPSHSPPSREPCASAESPDVQQLLDKAQNLAEELAGEVQIEDEARARIETSAEPATPDVLDSGLPPSPDLPESEAAPDLTARAANVEESSQSADPSGLIQHESPPTPVVEPAESPPETIAQVPDIHAAVEDDAATATNSPLAGDPAENPVAEQPAELPRPGIARRLLRRFTAAGVGMVLLPLRAAIFILAVLDLPFAGLSATAKQRIGYIAIATLLMTAMAYLLPGRYQINPYAHITDNPPEIVAEEAGSPAKPAAAKSGH